MALNKNTDGNSRCSPDSRTDGHLIEPLLKRKPLPEAGVSKHVCHLPPEAKTPRKVGMGNNKLNAKRLVSVSKY